MIDALVIRDAQPDEAHVVHAVTRAAFAEHAREPHPSSALRETLSDLRRAMADGGALLALLDGRAIGAARWAVDPGRAHLKYERLAVLPGHRGQGVGRAIIAWLERRVPTH